MIPSKWFDAVITAATDKKISAEVDLEGAYEFLTVIIPTLGDASNVTVHICEASGGTFVPVYRWDEDTAATLAHTTSDTMPTSALPWRIGGAQFIKVVCGNNQNDTTTTFRVRGFNRG